MRRLSTFVACWTVGTFFGAVRGDDLLSLLPTDALAYVELRQPGQHIARVLEAAGLVGRAGVAAPDSGGAQGGSQSPVLVSPRLLEALKSVEGAAIAITDFDPRHGIPQGVLVVDPGKADLVYGLIETALSGASAAREVRVAEPVEGNATFETPVGLVTLTDRLIVFGSNRDLVASALDRAKNPAAKSVATDPAIREALAQTSGSLLRIVINAKPVLARLKAEAFRGGEPPEEYRMAQAVADVESIQWAALSIGAQEKHLAIEARLVLDDSNQSLAFHLLRTPNVGKDALRSAPAGAAALLAFALGDPTEAAASKPEDASGDEAARHVTGLDFGREIFANVKDVVAFVLPWGQQPPENGNPPIPDVGLVFTVKDPARSEALWKQLLSVGALLSRGGKEPVRKEKVDGRSVHVYSFPQGIEATVLRLKDRVIVATSSRAIAQAVAAQEGKSSALDDGAIAKAWGGALDGSSKLAVLHAGRLLEMAAPFAHLRGQEADLMREALKDSSITIATSESAASLRLRVAADIPRIDSVLRLLLAGPAVSEAKPQKKEAPRPKGKSKVEKTSAF